jgi:glycosyltransferase involved in cell wall biosynthesis
MSAPEWEETVVQGDFGAEFTPDWWSLDLQGYRRPNWFIQGPAAAAFAYHYARRSGHRLRAAALRRALDLNRWQLGSRSPAARLVRRLNVARFILSKRAGLRWLLPRLNDFAVIGDQTDLRFGPVPLANGDTDENLVGYRAHAELIASTLAHYDIAQGYVLSGVYPAVAGFRNYAVYELGTLRDVPFQNDAMARICAWVYRSAPHVFVTNIDCIEAARRLGLTEEKTHAVLHAFDCNKALEYSRRYRAVIPVSDAPPSFLAPARHHWTSGHSSWRKGNDIIIRASCGLADRGLRFKITFVDWGEQVNESRRLIDELGVSEYFEWIRPVSKPVLWPRYMRAVGVIDQFVAPAMGGIALEALALGRPLLTRLDVAATRPFFTEPPPIFNVCTAEGLAEAMARLIADPHDADRIGEAGQAWIIREHSVERQITAQLEIYQQLLAADTISVPGPNTKPAINAQISAVAVSQPAD